MTYLMHSRIAYQQYYYIFLSVNKTSDKTKTTFSAKPPNVNPKMQIKPKLSHIQRLVFLKVTVKNSDNDNCK